ncbi:hypothetical protein V5E97_18855 [Singulisphaera sp. Ch08]|uniref:Uncharacterized protein n=1 Tax=Singulisphaera sp. Ch08 TaxID=3120278 RepID=A0AAU7CRE4_9BACT
MPGYYGLQLGPVTAMALDCALLLGYVPSASHQVSIGSLDFPGHVSFHHDNIPGPAPDAWGNYARGAAAALQARHRLERSEGEKTAILVLRRGPERVPSSVSSNGEVLGDI